MDGERSGKWSEMRADTRVGLLHALTAANHDGMQSVLVIVVGKCFQIFSLELSVLAEVTL